jgi:hypothetical protein
MLQVFARNQLKSQQSPNEWCNVTLGDIIPLCFVQVSILLSKQHDYTDPLY